MRTPTARCISSVTIATQNLGLSGPQRQLQQTPARAGLCGCCEICVFMKQLKLGAAATRLTPSHSHARAPSRCVPDSLFVHVLRRATRTDSGSSLRLRSLVRPRRSADRISWSANRTVRLRDHPSVAPSVVAPRACRNNLLPLNLCPRLTLGRYCRGTRVRQTVLSISLLLAFSLPCAPAVDCILMNKNPPNVSNHVLSALLDSELLRSRGWLLLSQHPGCH